MEKRKLRSGRWAGAGRERRLIPQQRALSEIGAMVGLRPYASEFTPLAVTGTMAANA
ncbi:MAG: hypothetical protein ACLP9L_26845 [Thermoguttaceae bacterium]